MVLRRSKDHTSLLPSTAKTPAKPSRPRSRRTTRRRSFVLCARLIGTERLHT